jgi:hypothetical protein
MYSQLMKVVLLALVSNSFAYAAPTAQDILAASDVVRNPDKPFSLTTTIIEYRNGKQTDGSTLAVYAKPEKSSGNTVT